MQEKQVEKPKPETTTQKITQSLLALGMMAISKSNIIEAIIKDG